MVKIPRGKGSVGTSTLLLPMTKKEKRQVRARSISGNMARAALTKAIQEMRNWHLDGLDHPYFVHPRTRNIVSGVNCPDDILKGLLNKRPVKTGPG